LGWEAWLLRAEGVRGYLVGYAENEPPRSCSEFPSCGVPVDISLSSALSLVDTVDGIGRIVWISGWPWRGPSGGRFRTWLYQRARRVSLSLQRPVERVGVEERGRNVHEETRSGDWCVSCLRVSGIRPSFRSNWALGGWGDPSRSPGDEESWGTRPADGCLSRGTLPWRGYKAVGSRTPD